MRILLSNDDGIHSPCLRALHDALCEAGHELDVVAPLTEQSGVGCSVTLHNPLRLYPVQEPGFSGTAVAGTPVDCVKLALTTLLPQPPDLVVVGINNGANKGVDVFYSGTVGAATEAALRGLPAVAFSRPRPELEPPQALARHAASLVDAVDWRCCAGKVLNVNYPRCRVAEIKGIDKTFVTLHVGLGNFRTVDVEDLSKHKMDSEQFFVEEAAAEAVNAATIRTSP